MGLGSLVLPQTLSPHWEHLKKDTVALCELVVFYSYMLYFCEKTEHLWESVIVRMTDLFQLQFSKSPVLCIPGLLPDNIIVNERKRLWVHLATTT